MAFAISYWHSNGYYNPHGPPLIIDINNIKYYKTSNLLKAAIFKIEGHEITSGTVNNNDISLTSSLISGKDSIFYNLMFALVKAFLTAIYLLN